MRVKRTPTTPLKNVGYSCTLPCIAFMCPQRHDYTAQCGVVVGLLSKEWKDLGSNSSFSHKAYGLAVQGCCGNKRMIRRQLSPGAISLKSEDSGNP